MPIGKNALKRVTNNGYSGVNVSAPDMEHSEIIEPKAPEKAEKPAAKKPAKKAEPKAVAKKAEPKKTEPKAEAKTVSAKAEPKKNTAPKAEKPKTEKPEIEKVEIKETAETSHPDGFVKVCCGMDMPAYLL